MSVKQPANPDLPDIPAVGPINLGTDPVQDANRPFVPPLVAHTPPMEQHVSAQPAYFVCSMPTASMHRQDGKKLPFVRGLLKTTIVEDIAYLRKEIQAHQNQYVREAVGPEIDTIEAVLNPKAAMEKMVRASVEPQIRKEMEEEIRAKILAELGMTTTDAGKIAGIDTAAKAAVVPNGVDVQVVPLKPVSSADVAHATAGQTGSGNAAAAAAAALAKAKASPIAPPNAPAVDTTVQKK